MQIAVLKNSSYTRFCQSKAILFSCLSFFVLIAFHHLKMLDYPQEKAFSKMSAMNENEAPYCCVVL